MRLDEGKGRSSSFFALAVDSQHNLIFSATQTSSSRPVSLPAAWSPPFLLMKTPHRMIASSLSFTRSVNAPSLPLAELVTRLFPPIVLPASPVSPSQPLTHLLSPCPQLAVSLLSSMITGGSSANHHLTHHPSLSHAFVLYGSPFIQLV